MDEVAIPDTQPVCRADIDENEKIRGFSSYGTYKYNPFDSANSKFRLVDLLPGSEGDELRCRIYTVRLLEKSYLRYEAVSYAWGSALKSARIKVLGRDHRIDELPITHSLAEALPYLRRQKESRLLWIDAICIDQGNLTERSDQVSLMGRIFSLADRCIAWLGLEIFDTGLAVEKLEYIASTIIIDPSSYEMSCAYPDSCEEHWSKVYEPPRLEEVEAIAIDHFYRRPWFGRLWVLQEISLGSPSSIIMCGNQTMQWQTFARATICLYQKTTNNYNLSFKYLADSTIPPYDVVRYAGSFDGLVQTIFSLGSKQCTDPRDRVYAVLQLCGNDEIAKSIRPDYRKPTRDVWRDVIEKCLTSGIPYSILCCGTMLEGQALCDLPSWVPDFTLLDYPEPNINFDSGAAPRCLATLLDQDCIQVVGIIIGEIAATKEFEPERPNMSYPLSLFSSIRDILYQHPTFTAPTILDSSVLALARIFCYGKLIEDRDPPRSRHPSRRNAIDALIDMVTDRSSLAEIKYSESDQVGQSLFLQRLAKACYNKKFFFGTSGDLCGICPVSALTGDKISVIPGCDRPIILRAKACKCLSEREEHGGSCPHTTNYEVVGNCYLNKYMYGEAVLGTLPENFSFILSGIYPAFRDIDTGEIVRQDPRLKGYSANVRNTIWKWDNPDYNDNSEALLSALDEIGVKYERFTLV